MSMKMNVPVMGTNTQFRQWTNPFLAFQSLKASYLIPRRQAHRDCGAYLDESAHSYELALLLDAVGDGMRDDQAVRCVTAA
jgi:hypothetical protein